MPTLVRVALLAGALSTVVVVGGPAPPAVACDCSAPDDAEALAGADAVFVATIAEVDRPAPGEAFRSDDPATYTFAVSEVRKGEVGERQEVLSEIDGASCGLELQGGGPFLVFASRTSFNERIVPADDQYYAGLCNGTRALAPGDDLAALGPARAPSPVEVVATPTPATVTEDGTDRTVAIVVASAVAGGVALGLGLVMVRHRAAA